MDALAHVQTTQSDGLPAVSVRYLTGALASELTFSVVSLVASQEKYDRLLTSFAKHGFNDGNSEFIALDNRAGNQFDGFNWLRRVAAECRGKYIVFTHDDVELVGDGFEALSGYLGDLDAKDNNWCMAGNAGVRRELTGRTATVLSIDDPHGSRRIETITQVESLDENFFVLCRNRLVLGSLDLRGFHLYAADLCLMTDVIGGSIYVIPFVLKHHSGGLYDQSFDESQARFKAKYRRFFPGRKYRTPAASFSFGYAGLVEILKSRSLLGRTKAKLKSALTSAGTPWKFAAEFLGKPGAGK